MSGLSFLDNEILLYVAIIVVICIIVVAMSKNKQMMIILLAMIANVVVAAIFILKQPRVDNPIEEDINMENYIGINQTLPVRTGETLPKITAPRNMPDRIPLPTEPDRTPINNDDKQLLLEVLHNKNNKRYTFDEGDFSNTMLSRRQHSRAEENLITSMTRTSNTFKKYYADELADQEHSKWWEADGVTYGVDF